MDHPRVLEARLRADQAQHRLMQTLHELQARLAPKTLVQNAWEGAKVKGADLAEDAVDAVRKRPVAATGIAAAVALFLAREPLMSLAGKIFHRDEDDEESLESTQETMESMK